MSKDEYVNQCMETIQPYLLGEADTCSYCDHLSPLILQEGQYTYITLAIGQIVEGYLQVCSQEHRTSSAGLNNNEIKELITMKKIVRKAFNKVYGTPGIAFEHGEVGSCFWIGNKQKYISSLCHHAHIHYVPVNIDIRKKISSYLPDEIIIHDVYDLKRFRIEVLQEKPYLYFEDVNEIGYAYPVLKRSIPRQFLRTCVAESLGVPERANWELYPGEEHFTAGQNKLKPLITELYESSTNHG